MSEITFDLVDLGHNQELVKEEEEIVGGVNERA